MANCAFLPIPTFVKDITGRRFGRLVVLGLVRMEQRTSGSRIKRVPVFLAQCDCGETKEALGRNMVQGITSSCGCLQAETRLLSGIKSATHRMTKSPEYAAWSAMRNRCYKPKTHNYPLYGGRGITVCAEWRDSFQAFFQDMGARPSPAHSLDRINVDGNYEPSNCRWATLGIQNTNRRNTVYVEMAGERVSLSEASRRCGLPRSTIGDRYKSGLRGQELFAGTRYAV